MSIVIEASESELDSPFFIRNKKITTQWAAFHQQNPGSLTGAVSAYYIKTQLKGVCKCGTYTITGNRQIKNIKGPIPVLSPFDDKTIIEIETGKRIGSSWKIRPKSFGASCVSLIHQVTQTDYNHNLIIISPRRMDDQMALRRNTLVTNLSRHGLSKLTCNPNTCTIELNRIAYTGKEITALIDMLDDFLSMQ